MFRNRHPENSKPSGTDMAFGIRPVQEAIEGGQEIERLLVQKDLNNPAIAELVSLCRTRHIPVGRVPEEKLNRITRKNHQGVICFLSSVRYATIDNVVSMAYDAGRDPFLLILDRITDVRNFGAIARAAECAGIDALIIPDRGAARLGGDAFKASAGALSHVAVCREHNLEGAVRFLKNNGLQIVACTEKTTDLLYEVDFKMPIAIILGSEEDGISPELLALADHQARIPLAGKIGSLNVSVACGVVVYEALRQRSGF